MAYSYVILDAVGDAVGRCSRWGEMTAGVVAKSLKVGKGGLVRLLLEVKVLKEGFLRR